MLKKKSYMNKDNILSEGFFDFLRKKIIQYPSVKKVKTDKKDIKNNKKVKNSLIKLNTTLKDLENLLNKSFKELDPKHKPIKFSKYKVSDLMREK